jgi:hypothetical protein
VTPLPPTSQSSDRYITTPKELHRRVAELAISAVALGVAAFGLRLVVALWMPPLAWKLPDAAGMALLLAATLLAAAAPIGLFTAHVRRYRRLPRTFLVPDLRLHWWYEGRAFVVAPTPWLAVFPVAYLVLAAGAVGTERTADGGLTVTSSALLSAFLLAQPAAAAVLWFLLRGPQLALTRHGLVVRGLRSGPEGRVVAWDHLDVSNLPVPTRRSRDLKISIRGGGAPPIVLPLTWLWVNPLFLAGTVRHYALHPEHRAAIGNEQELERLHRLLTNNHSITGEYPRLIPRQRAHGQRTRPPRSRTAF